MNMAKLGRNSSGAKEKKETTPFLDVDRAHGRTWTTVVLR